MTSGTPRHGNAAGPLPSRHEVLLVANKGDRAVGIIDPQSGQQVASIAEGGVTAHEVAASPDVSSSPKLR